MKYEVTVTENLRNNTFRTSTENFKLCNKEKKRKGANAQIFLDMSSS